MARVAQGPVALLIQLNANCVRVLFPNNHVDRINGLLGDVRRANQDKFPVINGHAMDVGILKSRHKNLPKDPGKDSMGQMCGEGESVHPRMKEKDAGIPDVFSFALHACRGFVTSRRRSTRWGER